MVRPDQIKGPLPSDREIYKTAIFLSLPAVAEMLLTSLIQMADTIMVGFLGHEAIAAVGITTQPRMIALCIFFALNVGVTAICARSKGEGSRENANSCLRQGMMIALGLSLVVAALMFQFAQPLLRLAGANDEMMPDALVYFRIMMVGLVVQVQTLLITAAQRGTGNTKISFTINLTANIVNVIFNYLLIGGNLGFPKLGVAGAAVASVIGLTVGLGMALWSVLRRDSYLHLSFKVRWKPDWEMLRRIYRVGSNALLEQLAMRVGFLIFARIVANLGTADFATHQIGMQLLNISFAVGDGMSAAATALVGQNLGAKRPDLSIIYGKTAQRIALVPSSILFVAFFFAGGFLVSLFSREAEIIAIGAGIMKIAAVIQVFQISQVIFFGCLRGAGDNRFVAALMLITVTVVRPVMSFLMVNLLGWGITGAWYAVFIDQMVRYILAFRRFSGGKWTEKVV